MSNFSYTLKFRDSDGQPDVLGLMAPVRPVVTDGKRMSARALLSAEVRDRQGDVVVVGGGDLSKHMLNPVCLWDHMKSYSLPIGVTRTPEGVYAVEADPHLGEMWQTTYFSQRSQMGEQVFALVDEGILAGNSPGFRPKEWDELPEDEAEGFTRSRGRDGTVKPAGKLIRSWELVEVSWCACPVNQEAARAVVGKSFAGRTLAPAIVESWRPWLPDRKPAIVTGGFEGGPWAYLEKSSAWDESKHPRADDGTFGSGSGKRGKVAEALRDAPGEHIGLDGGLTMPEAVWGASAVLGDHPTQPEGDETDGDEAETTEPTAAKAWTYLDDLDWLDGKARAEGETWQGPSGRNFVMRNGRAVPAKGPGKTGGGDTKPPAKETPPKPEKKPTPEKKPPAPKAKPAAKAKADPAAVKAAVEAAMRGEGDHATLAASLATLTVPEIKALLKEHGQKVSGAKAELADRMAQAAIDKAKGGGEGKEKPAEKEKPEKKPPAAKEKKPQEKKPQEKKAEEAKPAAKSPPPPEPGFTGFDTLGREWRDGELVPAEEAQPEPDDGGQAEEEAKPVPTAKAFGVDLDEAEQEQFVEAAKKAAADMGGRDGWDARYARAEGLAPGLEAKLKAAKILTPGGNFTAKGAAMAGLLDGGHGEIDASHPDAPSVFSFIASEDKQGAEEFSRAIGAGGVQPLAHVKKGRTSVDGKVMKSMLREAKHLHAKVNALAGLGGDKFREESMRLKADENAAEEAAQAAYDEWNQTKRGKDKTQKKKAYEAIRAKANAIAEQRTELFQEQLRAQRAARAEAKKAITLPDGEASAVRIEGDTAGTHGEKTARSVSEAADWLSGILAKNGGSDLGGVQITENPVARAFNLGGTILCLSRNQEATTVIHEYIHSLEREIPGLSEAVQGFLAHRCKGEDPVSMRDKFGSFYDENEMGRKDRFDLSMSEQAAYYAGKDYGDTDSEVLTIGVETLFRDPAGFARKDPEYCAFILGVLDGSIRGLPKKEAQ